MLQLKEIAFQFILVDCHLVQIMRIISYITGLGHICSGTFALRYSSTGADLIVTANRQHVFTADVNEYSVCLNKDLKRKEYMILYSKASELLPRWKETFWIRQNNLGKQADVVLQLVWLKIFDIISSIRCGFVEQTINKH